MPYKDISTCTEPMTDKQKDFADEYIANGFSAKQAYHAVFQDATESSCRSYGPELLKKPAIREYIASQVECMEAEQGLEKGALLSIEISENGKIKYRKGGGRSSDPNLPLTPSQKACVDYYLSHLPYNQTAAYNAIFPPKGRNEKTLQTSASRFFRNPRVVKYKEQRMQEIYDAANINAQSIALRLGDIAFDTDEDRTSYSLKALDLLQKQLGLQNQKVAVDADVKAGVSIVEDY